MLYKILGLPLLILLTSSTASFADSASPATDNSIAIPAQADAGQSGVPVPAHVGSFAKADLRSKKLKKNCNDGMVKRFEKPMHCLRELKKAEIASSKGVGISNAPGSATSNDADEMLVIKPAKMKGQARPIGELILDPKSCRSYRTTALSTGHAVIVPEDDGFKKSYSIVNVAEGSAPSCSIATASPVTEEFASAILIAEFAPGQETMEAIATTVSSNVDKLNEIVKKSNLSDRIKLKKIYGQAIGNCMNIEEFKGTTTTNGKSLDETLHSIDAAIAVSPPAKGEGSTTGTTTGYAPAN